MIKPKSKDLPACTICGGKKGSVGVYVDMPFPSHRDCVGRVSAEYVQWFEQARQRILGGKKYA